MAARLHSRLSFACRKGAREQEAEPGTPVTGQVSGYYCAIDPTENPPFSFSWVGRECSRPLIPQRIDFHCGEGIPLKRADQPCAARPTSRKTVGLKRQNRVNAAWRRFLHPEIDLIIGAGKILLWE